MCMRNRLIAVACGLAAAGVAAVAGADAGRTYGLGQPVSEADLSRYFAIQPDGRGLPPGEGTAAEGATLYAETCAACHGEALEGIPDVGIGGPKLIGGRGTLASAKPVKTVESYWPYATTLFDYVKRSMPFQAPGSLTDDEVYAVSAYILAEAKIIDPSQPMNAETLPKVEMPNRDGFISDPRPEHALYR